VKQILQSIALVLSISALISIPFFPDSFWKMFVIATGIQVFGGWIANTLFGIHRENLEAQRYNESLEILSQNVVNIPCTGCKAILSVPIFLNEDNVFECEKCNTKTRAGIEITPIMLTNHIDNIVSTQEIFNTVDKVIENSENNDN
jgi:hypothetical protein